MTASAGEPWLWTFDERLHERLDAANVRERIAAYAAAEKPRFVIDGARNPELFFSFELMNALSRGVVGSVDSQSANRVMFASGIRDFGWDEGEFWTRLERASAQYRAAWEALADDDSVLCAARFDALQTLRGQYGEANFNRFLYTVVAPSITVVSTGTPADRGARLRELEGGCR